MSNRPKKLPSSPKRFDEKRSSTDSDEIAEAEEMDYSLHMAKKNKKSDREYAGIEPEDSPMPISGKKSGMGDESSREEVAMDESIKQSNVSKKTTDRMWDLDNKEEGENLHDTEGIKKGGKSLFGQGQKNKSYLDQSGPRGEQSDGDRTQSRVYEHGTTS
jgi:hypothetical protein